MNSTSLNAARLLIFALPVLFLLNNCNKERIFGQVKFNTFVIDAAGHPRANVAISLRACYPTAERECDKYIVAEGTTDNAGAVFLKGKRARSDRYQVYGPNFEALTEEVSERELESDEKLGTLVY